jgi:hypothetical protein
MDFVVGLPLTSHRHNASLVIVDKLTKSAHLFQLETLMMSLMWHVCL